jgi:hypothetical protein
LITYPPGHQGLGVDEVPSGLDCTRHQDAEVPLSIFEVVDLDAKKLTLVRVGV